MTREECEVKIADLKERQEFFYDKDIALLIELLEQEPCEDCISRQAVLDVVSNPLNIRLEEIIKKLPSVTPQEPKTDSIPILKDTTNGDMWLKVFGGKAVEMTYNIVIVQQGKIERRFNKDWWDAPFEMSMYGKEYEQEPKGHWIVDDFTGLIKCDICGNDAYMDTTSGEQCKSKFCPNCGAKMEEAKDD